MDCSHGKWTSANSVFRFMTRCELCETKMLGIRNAAQCSDCGRYMHDSCAAVRKQTLAYFKSAESKTDATVVASNDHGVDAAGHVIVVGRAEDSTRGPVNSVVVRDSIPEKSGETSTGRQTVIGSDSAEFAGRETLRQAEGSVSAGKGAGQGETKPVITAAAGSGRSFLQSPKAADFGRRNSNRVCDGPKVWNPVRVGPPLLIPINGGPILITPPHDGQSEFDPIYYGLEIPKPVRVDPPPIWNPVRVGPPLLIPINGGPILVTPIE